MILFPGETNTLFEAFLREVANADESLRTLISEADSLGVRPANVFWINPETKRPGLEGARVSIFWEAWILEGPFQLATAPEEVIEGFFEESDEVRETLLGHFQSFKTPQTIERYSKLEGEIRHIFQKMFSLFMEKLRTGYYLAFTNVDPLADDTCPEQVPVGRWSDKNIWVDVANSTIGETIPDKDPRRKRVWGCPDSGIQRELYSGLILVPGSDLTSSYDSPIGDLPLGDFPVHLHDHLAGMEPVEGGRFCYDAYFKFTEPSRRRAFWRYWQDQKDLLNAADEIKGGTLEHERKMHDYEVAETPIKGAWLRLMFNLYHRCLKGEVIAFYDQETGGGWIHRSSATPQLM